MKRRSKKEQYKTTIRIEDKEYPVKVFVEYRSNVRVSIGKTAINFRMPWGLPQKKVDEYWQWLKDWTTQEFDKKPGLKKRFWGRTYEQGSTLDIYGRSYTFDVQFESRKSHTAKLIKPNTILLKLSEEDTPLNRQKSIRSIISRVVAQDCQLDFEKRVDAWNDQYFQETINNIRFKYNHSNWGSCSANRNLNFSTRLLFAPTDVIDYVIVHELAHLKELNHSSRFWKIVSDIMPDYKTKEKWLKEHGADCQF